MSTEVIREANRQRIIDVSTELFITQGIPMTFISQIAKKAGVVDRTVLNIFGTKQNLVLECMVHLSDKILDVLSERTSTQEYKSLCGLEQIMYLLKIRGEILLHRPDILLLVSEAKVWIARSIHDSKVVRKYLENVECLYKFTELSLKKGISDGSINPAVDTEQVLSIVVPCFRAVIQQLAQVKLNPEFTKEIDVESQLQIQYKVIRMGLMNHNVSLINNMRQKEKRSEK